MLTKIMKWVSIAVLLLAGLRLAKSYQGLLEMVVCVSGLLVVAQAVHAAKYFWAAGFLAIVVLFNPVVPIGLSGKIFLWLNWVCLAAFLVSLAGLKRQPTLSIPSITNRTPGSESL
jgi:hypothetical protein